MSDDNSGGGRGGRGGRGRGRGRGGARRGRGRGDGRDDDSNLQRFDSVDSLNGGRQHRGRGGGGRGRGGENTDEGHSRGRGRSRGTQDNSRGGRGRQGNYGEEGNTNRGRGDRRDEGNGRQGGGPANRAKSYHFPLRHVVQIEDVDEITMRLASQMEQFEAFLSADSLSPDDATNVLKILIRVIQNDLQRESVLKILQVVCMSRFLDVHLTLLIQRFPTFLDYGSEGKVIEIVEFILQLLSQICQKLPSNATKGFLLLTVLNGMPNVTGLLRRKKPSLSEALAEQLIECQQCMNMLHEPRKKTENRSRFRRGPNDDEDIPPEDFVELPIFPSFKDMDWTEKLFLRANKEEGAFRDVNHYLDVQFRLLREDYIRPLRKGIKDYKQLKERGEALKKSQDVRLYNRVQIISMVCKESLEHRVQFEMSPQLKRMRWQSSKRLLYGSLVCLSLDDFDTIYFAVVTNRDIKDLEKGIIQVRFENGLEDILGLPSSEMFTMAETTAYFEAYRHVLEGLQEMKDSLPMSRYLVECNPTIKPPQYLLSSQNVGRMDLTALLHDRSRYDASSVTIINPQRWPSVRDTELNISQLEAVRTALSKELAIIQGPPGTGKTYVGLKVAKILLQNRDVWTNPETGSRPILVVCYTNHALDQFLEGILNFCPEGIVRVGSRCKTPELEEFNLKEIRKKMRMERKVSLSVRNSIRDCIRTLKDLQEDVMAASAKLEATTKGVVGLEALQFFMLPGQHESLVKKNQFTVPTTSTSHANVMMEWLTNGIITQDGEEMEEEDPYAMLAAEVTSQILQGEDFCLEHLIDPNTVHDLSPQARARLYRVWLQKAEKTLQQDVGVSVSQMWQKAAKREILPDAVLQRVVSNHLYAAITFPMMQQHQQQPLYCIRAWLGIAEGASQEVMSRILEGGDSCNEGQFSPDEMAGLPRKTRVQLYRFWLQKAKKNLKNQIQTAKRRKQNPQSLISILDLAKRDILPDEVLMNYMDVKLYTAIRLEMLQRHEKQSQYLIRAWLGIQEFCQNPQDLERLLEQLEGDDMDVKDEDEQLNIEEEADLIQNERQLDDGGEEADLFDFVKKQSRNLDVKSAMQELGVQSASNARTPQAADADGWVVPNYHKKQQAKKLQHLLTSSKPMADEEAEGVVNVWSQQLSVENRVRLYLFWLHRYQNQLRESVKDEADEYDKVSRQLRELRLGEDKVILEQATVIGMTTTGAARYRRVLASVACPIVILEEAAEVLEAHVVTTLHKKCQHLILIGDHQQLRPSPTVYELCRHFKLDLSLFERLVNNQLHHSTLAVQHRMRPEVARFVRHVYPKLQDHGSTVGRPHIRGVKQDVFLFHHEREETRNDETSSKSNQHEAELCVKLCRYLLQQDYPADTITILTAYSGQVFALKNIMKKEQSMFQGVRVTAVDNYQGEENDVIILSLVRSNQEGSVGFLGTDNRVCVALSRAKNGFYAFGNFRILAHSSELWKNICQTAKDNGQLGDTLVLRCENHPQQEIEVTTAKDFNKSPEGGCKLPCGTRLESCGHVCELGCHGYDRNHEKYKCRKKCERVSCKLGHPCTKKCFQDCGKCMYKVQKVVPMCGHVANMECSKDPHTWDCKERCKGALPCGHQCSGSCMDCRKNREHDQKCTEEVERVWPCGHLVKSPCNIPAGEWPCNKPCDVTLECGHTCQGTCGQCWAGRVHVACKEKCGRMLPGCGHKCRLPCGTVCLPCKEKSCRTSCVHSSCKQPCGVPCLPCKELCPWKKCPHQKCDSLCHQPCLPCGQPCGKKLKCNLQDPEHPHVCSGLCSEKCFCFTCEKKNFVPMAIAGVMTEEESQNVGEDTKLIKLRCGHIFIVDVLDVYVKKKCQSLLPGVALSCPFATCNEMILAMDCWRYHGLMKERHDKLLKAKQDLVTTTTITSGRRQKLLDSLSMLTHDAEAEKSFASKAARGQIFSRDSIDVNMAFALTNQIKLAKVFEVSMGILKKLSSSRHPTSKEIQVLQKILYKTTPFLTQQRLRELKKETLRFVIMTKLATAIITRDSVGLRAEIDSTLEKLGRVVDFEGKALSEANSLLLKCDLFCEVEWANLVELIDTSILEAPPDQDLCDVGKAAPSPSAKTTIKPTFKQVAPKITPSSVKTPSDGFDTINVTTPTGTKLTSQPSSAGSVVNSQYPESSRKVPKVSVKSAVITDKSEWQPSLTDAQKLATFVDPLQKQQQREFQLPETTTKLKQHPPSAASKPRAPAPPVRRETLNVGTLHGSDVDSLILSSHRSASVTGFSANTRSSTSSTAIRSQQLPLSGNTRPKVSETGQPSAVPPARSTVSATGSRGVEGAKSSLQPSSAGSVVQRPLISARARAAEAGKTQPVAAVNIRSTIRDGWQQEDHRAVRYTVREMPQPVVRPRTVPTENVYSVVPKLGTAESRPVKIETTDPRPVKIVTTESCPKAAKAKSESSCVLS